MAGGFLQKQVTDPKKKTLFSSGKIFSPENESKGLKGNLEPNKAVEFGNKREQHQIFNGPSYIERELAEKNLKLQREIKEEIKKLQEKIQKLNKAAKNIDRQTEVAISSPIPISEATEYHLNWLQRIVNFIEFAIKTFQEAGECFAEMNKKLSKKKGAFWGKFKKGGMAYLDSSEHSIARSAN